MASVGGREEALRPLSTALGRGPMPLSQTAKIVDRVCALLAPMHVAGRTHGGVSIETVRYFHEGGVLEVELDPPAAVAATYVAPEVARGQDATARSDIYQVGILTYHLIAGAPPFSGETDDEILRQHLSARPPSLEAHELQDVPVELDELIQQMLAKNPNARPKNVEVIRARIANLELDSTVMGMRLEALREAARDLGAATPESVPEEAPTRLQELVSPVASAGTEDVTIPPNPPVMRPPIEASLDNVPVVSVGPPAELAVDPFADTFIRDRAELELDVEDTQMSLAPEERAAHLPWVVHEPDENATELPTTPSRALEEPSTHLPAEPERSWSWTAVGIGIVVFVVTLAFILWIAS